MDGRKPTAKFHELQQILTIPEENALAKCITHLAIVGHPLKHIFIHELAEEIWFTWNDPSEIWFSIGNSWVQRFIYHYSELEIVCS